MQVSDKGLILKWFVVMPPLRHVTVHYAKTEGEGLAVFVYLY